MSTPANSPQTRAAIILVNWNGWRECIECIDSVLAQGCQSFHLFIVDNDSQDQSVERISDWCKAPTPEPGWRRQDGVLRYTDHALGVPLLHRVVGAGPIAPAEDGCRITLIRSGGNLGFAGGCNVGVKAAGLAEFSHFWLLNPDTVVHHDALNALLRRMYEKPDLGIVGSTLVFYDNPGIVYALGGGRLDRRNGYGSHLGQGLPLSTVVMDGPAIERDLSWVCGASMLVSTAFVRKIGLMQEDYFLYYEEADWATRGIGHFQLGFAPDSLVFHKSGANSSKIMPLFTAGFYYRSRLRFVSRFWPDRMAAAKRKLFVEMLGHVARGKVGRGPIGRIDDPLDAGKAIIAVSTMRILTIAQDLQMGGLQRVARNFALGYRRFGIESAYFAYNGGGPFAQQLADSNVDVIVGAPGAEEQREALKRALAWRPDVVHIHRNGFSDKSLSAMLLAARETPRRNTAARVGVVETNVFGRVDYGADRGCIDIHYLISKWCLWKWQRWSKSLSPRPIGVVMPNLVLHGEFSQRGPDGRDDFRRAHGIPSDALVFGRIGSLFEAKWSPIIFDAFSAYASSHPRAWLLLVGLPDALRPCVSALPPDIRQRVVLIDFMKDDGALRDVYRSMDVFLHAARIGESFGMVLAEALLCGLPVITLSTPDKDNSQLEVVGHEIGGLVVADMAGMLEAMQRLADPMLRQRYADRGAQGIVRRFSAEALIPAAIDIAHLVSEGLSPAQLRLRLLAQSQLCTHVSSGDIAHLMQGCLGRYSLKTRILKNLVSNPHVYRAYRVATRQPV